MAGLINYIKKAFKNYPDTTTKLSAENLNHLDNGIFDLDQAIGNALGTADISTVGDGTVKGAISTLNNDLTANSQKFKAAYQNGKYGFTINNTFYEIGGGGMPVLDYAHPLHTLSTTNWPATKDCYLLGSIFSRNSGPGVLYINDEPIMSVQNTSGIDSNAYGSMSIPILKIKAGDTVRVSDSLSVIKAYEEIQ